MLRRMKGLARPAGMVTALVLGAALACDNGPPPRQEMPTATPTQTTASPLPVQTKPAATDPACPPLDDTCRQDSDCGMTLYGPDCCGHCSPTYGKVSWVSAYDACCKSKQMLPGAHSCPPTAVGCAAVAGTCVNGRCGASQ
jgi:hypothetical protein